MTTHPADQVCSPPELPPYLKSVYHLRPVVGAPSDEELIRIHAVIRVAQKAADIPGVGDPIILSRLSEHLFDVQMARYRRKYLNNIFPENTIYSPPVLPTHVSIQLTPIIGAPSEDEVIKVQNAIRLSEQYAGAPLIFDPRASMELSQHLFDIQMARYTQRARQSQASHVSREPLNTDRRQSRTVERTADAGEEHRRASNDARTGAGVVESSHPTQREPDMAILHAIEQSVRVVEQANRLVERSNEQFDRSNRLAEVFMKPAEKIEEVLGNINRVLVTIQHAIVRNHKSNTINALDSLVNEQGKTPGVIGKIWQPGFRWLSGNFRGQSNFHLPVLIDGSIQDAYVSDQMLGYYLRFYGIGDGCCEGETSVDLKAGKESTARQRLRDYLSSCLG